MTIAELRWRATALGDTEESWRLLDRAAQMERRLFALEATTSS